MKKWEYMVRNNIHRDDMLQVMQRLGKDGWEHTHTEFHYSGPRRDLFLKREIPGGWQGFTIEGPEPLEEPIPSPTAIAQQEEAGGPLSCIGGPVPPVD